MLPWEVFPVRCTLRTNWQCSEVFFSKEPNERSSPDIGWQNGGSHCSTCLPTKVLILEIVPSFVIIPEGSIVIDNNSFDSGTLEPETDGLDCHSRHSWFVVFKGCTAGSLWRPKSGLSARLMRQSLLSLTGQTSPRHDAMSFLFWASIFRDQGRMPPPPTMQPLRNASVST